jgi:hypothetical protein
VYNRRAADILRPGSPLQVRGVSGQDHVQEGTLTLSWRCCWCVSAPAAGRRSPGHMGSHGHSPAPAMDSLTPLLKVWASHVCISCRSACQRNARVDVHVCRVWCEVSDVHQKRSAHSGWLPRQRTGGSASCARIQSWRRWQRCCCGGAVVAAALTPPASGTAVLSQQEPQRRHQLRLTPAE